MSFTIHVICLDVDETTTEQLLCIAGAVGGTYYDARSATKLEGALDSVRPEVIQGMVADQRKVAHIFTRRGFYSAERGRPFSGLPAALTFWTSCSIM